MSNSNSFFNVDNPAPYGYLYTLAPLAVAWSLLLSIGGFILIVGILYWWRKNDAKSNYKLIAYIMKIMAIFVGVLTILSIQWEVRYSYL